MAKRILPALLLRRPSWTRLKLSIVLAVLMATVACLSTLATCFVLHPTAPASSHRISNPFLQRKPIRLFYSNSTSEISLPISDYSSRQIPSTSNFKLYCDMDGVLVDFEKGVYSLLQTGTSTLDKQTMWKNVARIPHWFEQLEWKQDGKRLWKAIKHLRPDILTGVPDIQSSCVDKYNWCKRELELEEVHHVDMAADGKRCAHESINGNSPREDATNVITCWSTNKYRECKSGSVLIDDRIDLKDSWESAGGIFIHHINTESTLEKLREHGILPEELEGEEWYWEGSWRLWRV